MKVYAKILGVVLVALAIQLALAAGGMGAGDTLVSRAFTVASNINSLVSRAFTVSSNTDSLVSRAFTVSSNSDSLVSRAFTVSSNTDSLVSRAFTVSSNIDSLVSRAFTVVVNCDDGLEGLCPDCDNDGIPDGCELDCGPVGGPCYVFFPDCGQSEDCDGNGVPDECQLSADICGDQGGTCTINCDDCNGNCMIDACEIANCAEGELDCNDCNLNGIPDVCDDPEDSIPDECIEWDGGAGDDHSWNTVDNWEGNQVPGGGGAGPEESVVIAGVGAEAILDIDVSIDSLLLGSGATLHIVQEDEPDNMTVESGGAILVEGNLLVASDREINAFGSSVTIGQGGVYQADPEAKGPVSARLKAGSVIVQGGGVVNLSGSMELISNGDMLLGELDDDGKGGCKGGDTPPDFNSSDSAAVTVFGSFITSGCARVNNDSSQELLLGGNFDNFSINPDTSTGFNWDAGKLEMNGLDQTIQTIEAAGDDRGPCWRGFNKNFVIGTLRLAENSLVLVIDEFDNQEDGTTECDEALYVGTLILEAGSELQTNGCHVYYADLIDNGGSIPGEGTDVLQVESYCADLDSDGNVGPFDLALLLGNWGPCPPEDDCSADLNGDGEVGPFDLAILLGNWGPV